ncbi:MAG TPA: hypothetical protein VH253_13100 [Phycisphaerae bacterium]|nr:hypothetical protein [Phycisphaerae bacterium]
MTANPSSVPTATPAPAPKRRGRRWWKILLAIVILIIILILLLPTLLSTGAGARFLLNKVNARIPGKISADSLSLGWFSGAKIRNLKITGPDGNVVIAVASADTGLTLIDALSTSSMDLGNIVVRGFKPYIITYADGTTNIGRCFTRFPSPPLLASTTAPISATTAAPLPPSAPSIPAAPSPTHPMRIKGTLDLDDSQVTWVGYGSPILTLANLKIKSAFDTGTGNCDLDLAADATSGNDKPTPLAAKFSGNFFSNGNLKPLGAMTGDGQASAKSIDLFALSPIFQAAGLRAAVTGKGDLSLTLANASGKETLALNAPFTNVTLSGPATDGDTLRLAKANLSLNAALTGDTVDLQKFQLASDLLNASGNGSIKTSGASSGPLPPLTLNVAADVTALKKQLPKLLGNLPDTQAAASITGRIDLAARTLTTTAPSAISEKDPKTNQGNALVIDPDSTLSWGAAPNDLHAAATYDLARIQQILAKSLPDGTTLAGTRTVKLHISGPINTAATGLQMLAGLSIDPTTVGFDRIAIKGLDLGRADVPFAMKTGLLTLTPSDVPANGGAIHLEGHLDLTKSPALFAIDKSTQPIALAKNIQLNHELAAGPLAFLPLAWGGQKNQQLTAVSGLLNLSLSDASIPLDSAALRTTGTLHGSLRIDNLTTDAPIFTDLLQQLGPLVKITQPDALAIRGGQIPETPFALQSGKVTYQNLTIHAQSTDIFLSGSVGLDSSLAMNMSVNTQGLNIAIPVGLSGTTSSPKLAISPDALKGGLQNFAPKLQDLLKNK